MTRGPSMVLDLKVRKPGNISTSVNLQELKELHLLTLIRINITRIKVLSKTKTDIGINKV